MAWRLRLLVEECGSECTSGLTCIFSVLVETTFPEASFTKSGEWPVPTEKYSHSDSKMLPCFEVNWPCFGKDSWNTWTEGKVTSIFLQVQILLLLFIWMIILLESAWFCFLLFWLYTDSTFNYRKVYMHISQWKHKSCSVYSRCKNIQNLQRNHLNSFKTNNQVSFPVKMIP